MVQMQAHNIDKIKLRSERGIHMKQMKLYTNQWYNITRKADVAYIS